MLTWKHVPVPGGAADSSPDHPDKSPVPACVAFLHLSPHHIVPDRQANLNSLAAAQTPQNTICLDFLPSNVWSVANGATPVLPWNCDIRIPLVPLLLVSIALALGQVRHIANAQKVLPAAIM